MTSPKLTRVEKTPLSQQLGKEDASLLQRYQAKVLGRQGWGALLHYELATLLFGDLSGALGYGFRKQFYSGLFRQTGKGVIFGRGLVLRHPDNATLGDRVAIDDYGLLDASGAGPEGIRIGNDAIISRNCVIQGKTGPVVLGDRADIGCNVTITSSVGIYIGNCVLIGANCYIGGGRYAHDRLDLPMIDQGVVTKGPVRIGDDVWLGAGATVLDGVSVGRGCIVGAGAVVVKDLPDYAIAVGVPAKVLKIRQPAEG